MDLKIFLTTFVTIFLAELGDKTQLAALSISSQSESTWSVFLGSAAALIVAAGIGVFFGKELVQLVDPQWIKKGAGALFILMGAWILYQA